MPAMTIGLMFLLVFSTSQALRDVFFSNALQSLSVAIVATIAFGLTVLVFGAIALWRRSGMVQLLRRPRDMLLLNIATGVPWISYLIALRYLEPALVNTVFAGIGPLAVLAVQRKSQLMTSEWIAQAGIGLALLWLVVVAITGVGGVASQGWQADAALIGVLVGGVLMAWGHMLARRLNDEGIAPEAVFSARFLGAFGVGVGLLVNPGSPNFRRRTKSVDALADWIGGDGVYRVAEFLLADGCCPNVCPDGQHYSGARSGTGVCSAVCGCAHSLCAGNVGWDRSVLGIRGGCQHPQGAGNDSRTGGSGEVETPSPFLPCAKPVRQTLVIQKDPSDARFHHPTPAQ